MNITPAAASDLTPAVRRLVPAFAQDGITGYLLQTGAGYEQRLARFFSLLMRARLALDMPVLVARDGADIVGAAMGYRTSPPPWPAAIAEDWDRFEASVPGLTECMAVYDAIAEKFRPPTPHYYLGVIGVDPARHGRGIGARLLESFCAQSAADALSGGVYLETAQPANVGFYARAGFEETGRGRLGADTLWCLYLPHRRDRATAAGIANEENGGE